MRKKITVLALMLLLPLSIWAQDTIRHIIISEIRFDGWENCYVEFTNTGDSAVDLSNFIYGDIRGAEEFEPIGDEIVLLNHSAETLESHNRFMRLWGILGPGETTIAMNVYDRWDIGADGARHPIGMVERASMHYHGSDGGGDPKFLRMPYLPQYEMWGFDSIENADKKNCLNHRDVNESAALFWTSGDTIQVLVDQSMLELSATTNSRADGYITVAGVPEAASSFNLVRKFSIKEGETDWAKAVGVDETTSQWLLYPHREGTGTMVRETEGYHGDYHIDVTSDVCNIQEGSITVPWGTEKHDSIRPLLTLGKGMAWWYRENSSYEDSLSTICRSGDTLELYAFGIEKEFKQYVIAVSEPLGDMVDVFARHSINWPDPEDEDYTPEQIPLVGNVPYRVMEYESVMDSIIDVPYAVKVDTLFSLLEKAPNATWEIVFAGGVVNNEVTKGDILRVTGGDGTTVKDYFIRTNDYAMSDNVNLASITWPDNPFPFLEDWKGDTIPGFINTGTNYKIMLPPSTVAVPVLVATTENLNSKLSVERAISLAGGVAERTTTFTVTSESDTVFKTIDILFEVEDPFVQLYTGHPIFTKFFERMYWGAGIMEICNPTGELIDLSRYMIVRSDFTTPAEAIGSLNNPDSATWLNRYRKYVPGYKWENSVNWGVEPGILEFDPGIPSYVDPGDVLVFYKPHAKPNKGQTDVYMVDEGRADIVITGDQREPGVFWNPWNEPIDEYNHVAYPLFPDAAGPTVSNYYLFLIINDSIRVGTKAAYDPEDFELVDVFGSPLDGPWMVGGKEAPRENRRFLRLPHSFKGATFLGEGLDTDWYTDAHSERAAIPEAERNASMLVVGSHTLDPISEQISTVSSLVYLVDKGFEGDIGIKGVSNSETVMGFYDNLIVADTAQILTVLSVTDGSARADGDLVIEGDTLQVVSANGVNTTKYEISLVALDNNATLTAKDGSGLVVDITDPTGTVGGFDFGMTIREVMESVDIPELAMLSVIDSDNQLVPLQIYNNDTIYVDLVASNDHYFEVVAENGKTIVYQLTPAVEASDAFVLSDIYNVAEEPVRIISQVAGGVGIDAFMNNISPVEGSTVKLMTISGQHRTTGQLSMDDVLLVTSADGTVTVTYTLNFIGEMAAYVTSDVFIIDQESLMITVPVNTTVEAMVAGLMPAPSAVVMVKDADGNEKSTGTVLETDMVEVISGDGRSTLTYTITVIVSVYNDMADRLRVYPNPASSVLYVENISMDSYVRISDITGRTLSLSQAFNVTSGIDLSEMRTGIYFLTIELDGKTQATVKFIKK